MERWIGIVGLFVFIGLAWVTSTDRRAVRWRQVLWGIGLQGAIAVLVLRVPAFRDTVGAFAHAVQWIVSFADVGAARLFGWLSSDRIVVRGPNEAEVGVAKVGAVVILKILPTLIFVSSLMAVLYHLGILQRVVAAMAWLMERTMRVSGAESLAAASNVFLGMTEAPLLIRPYLEGMTRSELLAVMVSGFATISSSMMAVYSSQFGVPFDRMLVASIMSAPAALYLTKLALPETGSPSTLGTVKVSFERDTVNFIDAAASGASIGLSLALNVGAMLLAFAAGLALIDASLSGLGSLIHAPQLSLGWLLGWLFLPIAWLMGTPAADVGKVGELLGMKIAANEYFAYSRMAEMAASAQPLAERSQLIAAFALCGFANLGSIAIQLGGIGALVPSRRGDLARLGFRAMLLGALATVISATIAGLIIPAT